MTVPTELQPFGPDVSHHNGVINWATVKNAGASFAFIKRSQGNTFIDSKGKANVEKAKDAGLITGVYHYLDYENSGAEQARFFLSLVGNPGPGMLPHTVDIENDTDDSNPRQYTRAEMIDCGNDFIIEYHRLTGQYPMIYTYVSFWRDVLDNMTTWKDKCPLWIADYSHKKPRLVGGWSFHTFHQFTSTGSIAGIPTKQRTDLNRFNGSITRLKVLAGMP